ncbi:MAG: D-alanine--D-alanine ligase family protein [Bellilinea sp.]
METIKPETQEMNEEEKPPSSNPRPARRWRVAVIANVKGDILLTEGAPDDAGAEFDKPETIQSIQKAIESDGHQTVFLPADSRLPFALREYNPDICFNIAEGLGGDGREAQVPALLEMMRIPYTASRVVANAVSLDKTLTKRLWREAGLPTAPFQEFITGDEALNLDMHFPLFVKPAREGTGMGMDAGSIVRDEEALRRRVRQTAQLYRQPTLVETYLPGREFTVAVMGRSDAAGWSRNPQWYQSDGFHRFPLLEVLSQESVTPGVYGHAAKKLNFGEVGIPDFACPARLSAKFAAHLSDLAIQGHLAIGALDISRVDMRLDHEDHPCLIEINTLPGLTPDFSDLCVIAKAQGISYRDLILEILYLGAARFGLMAFLPDMMSERWPVMPSLTPHIHKPLLR